MKLSNIAVIFIVIVLPLLLILAYYVSLQIDTINMQTAYNTKLLESTKEAIEAFEINTVEWNESSSSVADSKRRDVFASINTFTTSLANNLGVAGTSKDYMLSRIPAIAYTLYDGYYIYSPTETKQTIKDDKGVVVCMSSKLTTSTYIDPDPINGGTKRILTKLDGSNYTYNQNENGRVLYIAKDAGVAAGKYYSKDAADYKYFTLDTNNAAEEPGTNHILKPFMLYAEQLQNGVVINYTLDNYVTVYKKEMVGTEEKYIGKSGYLNKIGTGENSIYIGDDNFKSGSAYKSNTPGEVVKNPISGIKFSDNEVKPEILSETISYKDSPGASIITDTFYYVYEAEKDIKAYYDGSGRFFVLDNDKNRVYVENLTEPIYKKCLIPVDKSAYVKLYRSLVADEYGQYKWYTRVNDESPYELIVDNDDMLWDEIVYEDPHGDGYYDKILYDYSAINYCVETYVFTEWFNNQGFQYADGTTIKIDDNNDPELNDSTFVTHKKEIIRNLLTQNLEQAITTYSKDGAGDFKLPELKESEWEQVVSNISIITFLQNIPIGMKYYNNYAIATSTTNKEFVNKNELYFYNRDTATATDPIYHAPYCDKYNETNPTLVGYRSIDYIYKYYQENDNPNYYIKHICGDLPTDTGTDRKIGESCYYCIVQRALQEDYKVVEPFKEAYYTTLARERYLQLESITIQQSKIRIEKSVSDLVIDYGGSVTYTVTIKNEGELADTINIVDYYNPNYVATGVQEIIVDRTSVKCTRTKAGQPSQDVGKMGLLPDDTYYQYQAMGWEGISIEPGEEIKIEYTATIDTPNIGDYIINTAAVLTYNAEKSPRAEAQAETQITKKVEVITGKGSKPSNVILVLDRSTSMVGLYDDVKNIAKKAESILKSGLNSENIDIKVITYAHRSYIYDNADNYDNVGDMATDGITTNYYSGLENAKDCLEELIAEQAAAGKETRANYVIFMSDGCPTLWQGKDFDIGINKINSIVNSLASVLIAPITGLFESAWYEKEGIVGYSLNILGTTKISTQISAYIKEELKGVPDGSLKDALESGLLSMLESAINGLANLMTGMGESVPKAIWNKIMSITNELKGIAEIHTIYFTRGETIDPKLNIKYGLEQMASDTSYSYLAINIDDLEKKLVELAEMVVGADVDEGSYETKGIIIVKEVSKVKGIQIGSTIYSKESIEFNSIIGKIVMEPGSDKGTLDLNDEELQKYFHQKGDIKITY